MKTLRCLATKIMEEEVFEYARAGERILQISMRIWGAPTPKHQLDRIDNSKGYSPENCRWVTLEEQQSNTRNNTFYTYKNERLTAAQWARKVGISKELLHYRISAGWTLERALTTKPRVVA